MVTNDSKLTVGQVLTGNDYLISANGRYKLLFEQASGAQKGYLLLQMITANGPYLLWTNVSATFSTMPLVLCE